MGKTEVIPPQRCPIYFCVSFFFDALHSKNIKNIQQLIKPIASLKLEITDKLNKNYKQNN